ncbi:MAG: molybdopterin-binding protein [Alphaproteobacteria bacterium]|nr:molybdopterin-binding protein [Alphaproteobacteria bacterium]
MPETDTVTACVIVIGNEILSGRTRDANLHYLAERLAALGIRLAEARVIPDRIEAIAATVNEARARYDYVFTTGGIGPTHDDITADAVAQAFGVALEHHPEALAILETQYAEGEFNEARRRMARVPAGGTLIHNPVSKAPGFQIENVFVMAGVPMIMKEMFEGIRDRLVGGAPMLTRTIASGLAEGQLAGRLGDLQARFPAIDIGSYPYYRAGRFGVAIVLRGIEEDALEAAAQAVEALMRELGAEPVREQT